MVEEEVFECNAHPLWKVAAFRLVPARISRPTEEMRTEEDPFCS